MLSANHNLIPKNLTFITIKEMQKQYFIKSISNLRLVILALLVCFTATAVQAQTPMYSKPSWWFGAALGANFNFYRGSTHKLNDQHTVPAIFDKGFGLGLYAAPSIEYYKPKTMLGFMFQLGYHGASGEYEQTTTPCNCPADLSTKVSYLSIEPNLRFAPFRSGFYLYAGPRFALNMKHDFTYQQKANPDFPNQKDNEEINGEMSNMKPLMVSMQVGAGYDIPLSSQDKKTQYVLSPFIAFQPYFGNSPRTIETWNITTLRVGTAFKFGCGKLNSSDLAKKPDLVAPMTTFSVSTPANLLTTYTVHEIFPLRNYIFFDLGSNDIPKRYVLLNKKDVSNFDKKQVQLSNPENVSGRSNRQMTVYYNILNILGDRMVKNLTSTISLVGSSEKNAEEGLVMAEKVKSYLTDVFGIAENRIKTTGNTKPINPSAKPGQTTDLDLIDQGDRRVTIESEFPILMAKYETGLSPDEAKAKIAKAAEDNIVITNNGSKKAYSSWSVEIKDKRGATKRFGPYTDEKVSISNSSILGSRPDGIYNIKMIGTKKDGGIETKDTTVTLIHSLYNQNKVIMRYSVIFEYDVSKTSASTDAYLTEVLASKIPKGATVVIHGFTDIIGDSAYNRNLSIARANDVKKTLQAALAKLGRTDVKFEIFGYGEDPDFNKFNNKYPEERFYNRSVSIDILEAL